MPTNQYNESFVELFDVSKRVQLAKVPLASITFMPRTGERVFLSLHGPGTWEAYTVVNVEYFLGFDLSTGQPTTSGDRITLYVEESKYRDSKEY